MDSIIQHRDFNIAKLDEKWIVFFGSKYYAAYTVQEVKEYIDNYLY